MDGPSTTSRTAAPPRRVDPRRLARIVRRAILPFVVVAAIVFYCCFGAMRVPAGMDSMPGIPPGSWCFIDKRAGSVRAGSEVFVDLPEGGTLLTRVVEVDADGGMTVRNDDPHSALPDSKDFGVLPRRCLRGVVLVVFAAGGAPGEVVRGR